MMMIVGAVSRVLARAPEAKGEPHLIRILIHILIHPRPCAAAGPAAASQSRRTPCGTGSGGGPSGPGARGRTPPPWRHGIPGPRRPELPSTQPCPASLAFRSLAGTNSALSLSLSLSLCGERNETCDDSQASCLGRGVWENCFRRLKGTLCVVEAQGTGDLDAAAKAAVVCAQKHLPKPIWAVVASRSGTDGEALAKSVAGVDGVEKVVLAEAEGGKWCANTGEREREREEGNEADASATSATGLLAEPLAKTLRSLVGKQEPTHVVTGSSTFGKNLAPRLAALLDASPVTDVLEVVD